MESAAVRSILKLGLPTAVQTSVLNLSYLVATGMFNACGVAAAAAAGIGLKINTFAAMPCWAVGSAVTTMAGQCLGAGDTARAGKTARTGMLLSLAVTLLSMLPVQLCASPIIAFFDPDPEVVAMGVRYLRICFSFNSLFYAVMYTFDSFATGVGDTVFAMANALLQSVFIRLTLSALLSLSLGYAGLCLGEMLSPLLPCAAGVIYFCSGRWKKRRLPGTV